MTKTTQYKNTPIGPIPTEWKVKKLGELGEFKNGINKDKEDFGFGFPMVNLMDIFGINILNNTTGLLSLVNASNNDLENYNLKKGDVIFVRSSVKPSGVGLTTLINNDFDNVVYSGFLIRFRSNSIFLDHNFKTHCFYADYFRNKLISKSTISANTNINQVALSSLPLIIPPLPEQQKIAEVLSTWDKAIQETDTIIKKLQDRNKALAFSLLRGKKRVNGFEDKWDNYKLDHFLEEYSSKPNGEIDLPVFTSSKNGLMSQSDYYSGGRISSRENVDYNIIPDGYITYRSRSDDGLFTFNKNTTGYDGLISGYYPVFKVINGNDNFFLYYLNFFKTKLTKYSTGTSQLVLSFKALKSATFNLPSLEEQNAIAEILNTANQEVKQYQQKLEALKLQKKGLMQQLLTGKVRTV